jgi:hypothetical protein
MLFSGSAVQKDPSWGRQAARVLICTGDVDWGRVTARTLEPWRGRAGSGLGAGSRLEARGFCNSISVLGYLQHLGYLYYSTKRIKLAFTTLLLSVRSCIVPILHMLLQMSPRLPCPPPRPTCAPASPADVAQHRLAQRPFHLRH